MMPVVLSSFVRELPKIFVDRIKNYDTEVLPFLHTQGEGVFILVKTIPQLRGLRLHQQTRRV